jgi:hypothetical protein
VANFLAEKSDAGWYEGDRRERGGLRVDCKTPGRAPRRITAHHIFLSALATNSINTYITMLYDPSGKARLKTRVRGGVSLQTRP